MADGTDEPKVIIDEPIWSYEPFDRSLIRLSKTELTSAFSYIAVHGTPTDFTLPDGLALMRWELVCVYCDENKDAPVRTVTFEVKGRPKQNWFEPYISVHSEIDNYDDTEDSKNVWWTWPLSGNFFGNMSSFQRIVDLLEKAQNRYEKLYVNGETLEGTFLWVREIVKLLEEMDVVWDPSTARCGESMVAVDLTNYAMDWMDTYKEVYYCL